MFPPEKDWKRSRNLLHRLTLKGNQHADSVLIYLT